jgi:hypothetical protein
MTAGQPIFVADQFIDGRRMRILIVVDDCTRECLALADTSISGIRVARQLDHRMAFEVNSVPLSLTIISGLPRSASAMGGRSQSRLALHRAWQAGRMLSLSHSLAACATSCSSN